MHTIDWITAMAPKTQTEKSLSCSMGWTSFSKTVTILDFAVLATVPSVAATDHEIGPKLVLQNILHIIFSCLRNDSQSSKNVSICFQNLFFPATMTDLFVLVDSKVLSLFFDKAS